MKRLNLLIVLFCGTVISSCDPMTTYKKVIHNDSEYTLTIKNYTRAGTLSSYELQATHTVNPKSELILSDGSYLGDPKSQSCIIFGDSLVCSVASQENVKVDFNFNDGKNWERSKSGNSAKGYRIECHSAVKNENIKPE